MGVPKLRGFYKKNTAIIWLLNTEILYPSLLNRLNNQHTSVAEIIKGIDEAHLLYRPEPGKWNIVNQLAHLATYQPMFTGRIRLMLSDNDPIFAPYKADTDLEFASYQSATNAELIEKISSGRQELLDTISGLTADQLERRGTHLVYGRLTIAEWLDFFILHEAHHLFAIFKLTHTNIR
jgi:uncharacterized damage-inducible protein DinB